MKQGELGQFNDLMDNKARTRQQSIVAKAVGSAALSGKAISLSQLSTSAYSSSNIASTLVYRDVNGNFACGTITGKTTGNESPLTFNAPLTRSANTISITANTYVLRAGDTMTGNLNLTAVNIVTDTSTGTKIGTATTQKLGFFNQTPIAQPSAVGSATGYAAGATAATFHSDDTYTGNMGSTAYTLNGIVAALKGLGLIAA